MTDSLHGKTIVVMGFARQGRALARWLPTIGAKAIVTDMRLEAAFGAELAPYRQNGVEFVLGEHPLHLLNGADVLCLSGGVPLDAPLVEAAVKRGIPLSNDAQLFLERCPAPVIGITGSAGKTTTTTLVGEMCRADGRVTYVGGNIGEVLLGVLPGIQPSGIVVMELSSFQLELMTVSPPVGAVLNITPNHLDRHGTMAAYTAAKANLIRYQKPGDVAILNRDDPGSAALAPLVQGQTAWFSGRASESTGAFLRGAFLRRDQVFAAGLLGVPGADRLVVACDEIRLPGQHNVMNALAACAIAGAAGVSVEAMREAILGFSGVAHRQERVRVLNGVTWVNDSIATAPERVLAALRSYDEPLVLLLGGKDKNLPWESLAELVVEKARAVIAFGHAGSMIAAKIREAQGASPSGRLTQLAVVQMLDEAVRLAAAVAQPGDVVLLSPGGTSYDAYPDFEARGAHFRQLVGAL